MPAGDARRSRGGSGISSDTPSGPGRALSLSSRDLLLLATLTLLWGVNWPIMKIGVQDYPPLSFRVLSMIFGVPVLWLFARAARVSLRVERQYWSELGWLAATNMCGWFLLSIWGVKMVASGRAAILGFTMPIWAALIGWLVFRERASARIAVGVGAAAAGIVLLISSEWRSIGGRPTGTVCLLLGAILWAVGTHLMRRRLQPTHPLALVFWSLAISMVVCGAIAAVLEHGAWLRWPNAAEWGSVLFNAVLVFGVAQVIWFRLASNLPPMASGLSVMLVPAVGLFSGMALLGERPHWQDCVALACVLVAIGAVLLPGRRDRVARD